MHVIRSATLRPGATLASIGETHSPELDRVQKRLIRGKSRIFWDPTFAGTKYGRDQLDWTAIRAGVTLSMLETVTPVGLF